MTNLPPLPGKHPNDWNDEDIELLRKLALDNQSARTIAASFPAKSRNAILGKAYRMGIKIRSIGLNRAYDTFWITEKIAQLHSLYFSPMGYSNHEIAAELGCGMGTLRRGIAKMRAADGPLKPKPNRGQFQTDGRHKERGPHNGSNGSNGSKMPFIQRPRTAAARAKARAEHPPIPGGLRPEPLPATAMPIMGLNGHTCRWPVQGEGWNMLYCGAETIPDVVYCGIHCRRAFAR